MEHVVFFVEPDGERHHRTADLSEAIQLVEALRNERGISEVSVHALTPVPVTFRAYYRVEIAPTAAESAGSGEATAAPPSVAGPSEPVAPVEGPDAATEPGSGYSALALAAVPSRDVAGTGSSGGSGTDVVRDLESGALESGALESGVSEAGVLESGVLESSVLESGVSEPGVLKSGVLESGVLDSGVQPSGGFTADAAPAGFDGPGPEAAGFDAFVPSARPEPARSLGYFAH